MWSRSPHLTDELELPIHLRHYFHCHFGDHDASENVTVPEPADGAVQSKTSFYSLGIDELLGFLAELTCVFIIPNPVASVPSDTCKLNPPLEPDTPIHPYIQRIALSGRVSRRKVVSWCWRGGRAPMTTTSI